MAPLAGADDVALALGLEDADTLSAAQTLRLGGLLARVSREFRREAGRGFAPGTSTVKLLTVAGRVRLPEPVDSEDDVATVVLTVDGTEPDWVLDGQELVLEISGRDLWSGVSVTVTYTHSGEIPDDVVAAVAAIVARHLTLDPNLGAVTEMAAGPFRQRFADWTNGTALLTADDCAAARAYRYPGTAIIIQKP